MTPDQLMKAVLRAIHLHQRTQSHPPSTLCLNPMDCRTLVLAQDRPDGPDDYEVRIQIPLESRSSGHRLAGVSAVSDPQQPRETMTVNGTTTYVLEAMERLRIGASDGEGN